MRIDPEGFPIARWIETPPAALKDDPRIGIRERDLQDGIMELAATLGFLAYHTHDSRRSPQGFPDLLLVHGPRRRTIYAELKGMRGHVTEAQGLWLYTLARAGNHVYLWTPVDWVTGMIERELRGPRV